MLFILELKYNLISLRELVDEANCFVTLSDDFCLIHDRTSRMPFGVVRQKDRIRLYQPAILSNFVCRFSELNKFGKFVA